MNCEFQFLYAHAGLIGSVMIVAKNKSEAMERLKGSGFRVQGEELAFVRFVPNGLPGDGLDLQQFADYLGDSARTARRMLSKVSHVRCGSRVSITVPALEEFERNYTLAGRNSTQRRKDSKAQCRSVDRRLFRAGVVG